MRTIHWCQFYTSKDINYGNFVLLTASNGSISFLCSRFQFKALWIVQSAQHNNITCSVLSTNDKQRLLSEFIQIEGKPTT